MDKKYGKLSKSIGMEATRPGRIRKADNTTKKGNVCDCGSGECSGCWDECDRCGSNKCSHFCRVGRKHPIEWTKSD